MFIKLVESFSPDGVICAFDKGKPQVRIDMLPQYKAQRPPMDPALHAQFPVVKELLKTLDVPVCQLEGWEGDDILGTLARRGEAEGYQMLLFTGDRDMYQLSTENVKIVSTRKGVSDVSIMTPETVADLYAGITPELVPDFYGLKGDSSDNIPGVPGIGPKKAAALIVEYGSLDEVIAHADEVKGKVGENLRAHIDDALLSRKVATIRTDAPLDINLEDAQFPTFDPNDVVKAFSALGFTGMTSRLARMAGGSAAGSVAQTASATPALPIPSEYLQAGDASAALTAALENQEWIGVAQDSAADAGALFSLSRTLWVSTEKALLKFEGENVTAALLRILREARVAADDVKVLLHEVSPVDSSEPQKMDIETIDSDRLFDTGVAAYLLESDRSSFDINGLVELYFGSELPEPTDNIPAAALRAVAARNLVPVLTKKLEDDGSYELFAALEMQLLPVLAAMERRGLYVDPQKLAQQSSQLAEDIAQRVASIHQTAGEDFNLDSPSQLSHILFDVLKLPNLQNIPTRSELGHRVRTAFTVPEGSVFLACDYSQIELRLLAHLSADEHLVAAFNSGADFHAATAARVFGVPVEEVTPALRSRAKAVNFGIVYGQQAFGLATSLKISRKEAQEMIDRYFDAYPGVRAYLDDSVRTAHETGYAITMYGRKRHIREFNQSNRQLIAFGERTAMNHPMQGSAADIIKIAFTTNLTWKFQSQRLRQSLRW